jgi:hypothetical protein
MQKAYLHTLLLTRAYSKQHLGPAALARKLLLEYYPGGFYLFPIARYSPSTILTMPGILDKLLR